MINSTMTQQEYRAAPGLNYSSIKAGAKSMLAMHHAMTAPSTPSTAAQRVGTLAHSLILEPSDFANNLAVWTGYENTKGEWSFDRRGNVWTQFAADNEGKNIVAPDEFSLLESIKLAAYRHPEAGPILEAATHRECSLFWDGKGYGDAKCRPDLMNAKTGQMFDLKTCADIAAFERSIYKYGYQYQVGWYLPGMVAQGIPEAQENAWGWIVVETAPPHDCAVFWAGYDVIEWGQREAAKLATEYRKCEAANVFPGYVTERRVVALPMYMQPDDIDLEG